MNILAENKKAYFDYDVQEKFQAGIVLTGNEVKSIKNGHVSLQGAYVVINKDAEVFLIGSNVPPYQPMNTPADYDKGRSRKLLLRKNEINYLIGKSHERGLTMIPLRVYTEKAKIKLEFGIAKGKKTFDKRESIKRREVDREVERELRSRG